MNSADWPRPVRYSLAGDARERCNTSSNSAGCQIPSAVPWTLSRQATVLGITLVNGGLRSPRPHGPVSCSRLYSTASGPAALRISQRSAKSTWMSFSPVTHSVSAITAASVRSNCRLAVTGRSMPARPIETQGAGAVSGTWRRVAAGSVADPRHSKSSHRSWPSCFGIPHACDQAIPAEAAGATQPRKRRRSLPRQVPTQEPTLRRPASR